MAGEGGIDVISNAGLIEVQRWWESEERYRSTFTQTNKNLFANEVEVAARAIFANNQLQALAHQQPQRQIRELYQLLAVIAYAQGNDQTIHLRNILEYLVQTPNAQNPDEGLWKFLRKFFVWQEDQANIAKLNEVYDATILNGQHPTTVDLKTIVNVDERKKQYDAIAFEKLSRMLFKKEVLLETLKACPQFLARCPVNLLFTMAKDNVAVAAYILNNQFQIDKMRNANKQELSKLIAVVAESAWSNEASSEGCKTAIYYLLEHNLAMFLVDSENDIRWLDYMLNFHLSPDPAKRARAPKDISTILDVENKNVITQLSRFFSSGRASQTLSQCPRFRNALDAKDLFDLAMIDYDMARFIFTDAVYRKRIETLPPVVGRGNALSRIEKYGYPGSLFFTHLVISSPPDSSNTSLAEVSTIPYSTHYRYFTAALVIFEGDKNAHLKAYTDSAIQSADRLAVMLEAYSKINFIEALQNLKKVLEQLSKLSKEDVTRANVEFEIKAAQANLRAHENALNDLNTKQGTNTLTVNDQEELHWLHIVNGVFPFNQLQNVCKENLPADLSGLISEVDNLLRAAKQSVGKLYKYRDDLMPQYKLWQLSGGRRAISKPVSKTERSEALNDYLLPRKAAKQLSPKATWQNIEDLIQLKGHYRTLVEMPHLTAMFASADDGERLGKLLRFIAAEPQLKNKLVNSKLFEKVSGNSVDKRETTEKQAIGNLQDLCYGEQSYFRENPDFAWVLFSDFPELCKQLFKNKPDEFIELLRAMQNKNTSKKAFLQSQSSWLDGNMLLRIAPALAEILTKKEFDSYFGWGFGKTPRKLLQYEANTIAEKFSTEAIEESKTTLIKAVGNSAVFDVIDFSVLRAVNLATNAKNPVVYSAISKRDDYVGYIEGKPTGDTSEYHKTEGEQTAIHIAVSVKQKIKQYSGIFNRAKLVAQKFRNLTPDKEMFTQAEWQYIANSHSRLWAALTEKPGYFSDERYESRTDKLKSKSPFCWAKLENKTLFQLVREGGAAKNSVETHIADIVVQNALLDEAEDLAMLGELYEAFANDSFKKAVIARTHAFAKKNDITRLLNFANTKPDFVKAVLKQQTDLLFQIVQLSEAALVGAFKASLKELFKEEFQKSEWTADIWLKLYRLDLVDVNTVPIEKVLELFKRRDFEPSNYQNMIFQHPALFKRLFIDRTIDLSKTSLLLQRLLLCFNAKGEFFLKDVDADTTTIRTDLLIKITEHFDDSLIQDIHSFDLYIMPALSIDYKLLHDKILAYWSVPGNFAKLNEEQQLRLFISPSASDEFRQRELQRFAPHLAADTPLGTLVRQKLTAPIFYTVLIYNLLGGKLDAAMTFINRDQPKLLVELLGLSNVDYAFIKSYSKLFSIEFITKLEPRILVKFFNPENGKMLVEHQDLPKTVIEVLIAFPSAYRFLLIENTTLGNHVRQKLERKELLDILVNGNFAVEEFSIVIGFYQAECPLLIKELLDQPKVDYAFIIKYEKAFVPDGEQGTYVTTLEPKRLIKFFNPENGQLLASVAARMPDFPKTITALVNSDKLKDYLFLLSDTSTLGTCARAAITPEKLKSFFDPNTWQILPACEAALTGYPALIEKLLLSSVAKVEKKPEALSVDVTVVKTATAHKDSSLDKDSLVKEINTIRRRLIEEAISAFIGKNQSIFEEFETYRNFDTTENSDKPEYQEKFLKAEQALAEAYEHQKEEVNKQFLAKLGDLKIETSLCETLDIEKTKLPIVDIEAFKGRVAISKMTAKKSTHDSSSKLVRIAKTPQIEMQNFVLLNAGLVDALVSYKDLSAEALLILLIELPEGDKNKGTLSAKLNDSHICKLIARAAELEDQLIRNIVGARSKITEVNKILGPMTSRIFALSAKVLLDQSEDTQRLFLTYFASFVRASNSLLKAEAEKHFQKLLIEKPLLFMRLLDSNGKLLKQVFTLNKQFFFGKEGSIGFLTLNLELIINNISAQQLVKLLLLDEKELIDFIFSDDRFVLKLINAIDHATPSISISADSLSRYSYAFGSWLTKTKAILNKGQIDRLLHIDQKLRAEEQHITLTIFSDLKFIDLIFDNEHITRYPDRFAACLSEIDLGNARKVSTGSATSSASSGGKSVAEQAKDQRSKLKSTSSRAAATGSGAPIKTTFAKFATLSDEKLICLFKNGNADVHRRILTNPVFAAQLLNTGNKALLPILLGGVADLVKLLRHQLPAGEIVDKAYGQKFRKALKTEGLRLLVKLDQLSINQQLSLIAADNQEICRQYQGRGNEKAQAIYDENGFVFFDDVVLADALIKLAFADADKVKAKAFIEKLWQKLEPVLNTQLKNLTNLTDVQLLFLMGCQSAAIVKWFDEQVAKVRPDFVTSQLRAIPAGTSIQSRWAFYLSCLEKLRDNDKLTAEDIKKCFGVNQAKVHEFLSSVYSKQQALVLQMFIAADSQTVDANLALFAPMVNSEDLWILNQASFDNTQFMKCFATDGAAPKEFVDGMMRMAKTQITGSNPFESLNPFKRLITLGVAEKANKSYAVYQIFQQNQALVTETLQAIDAASWSAEELTYLLRYADIAVAILKSEELCGKLREHDTTLASLKSVVRNWINNTPEEHAAQKEQFIIACFGSILCGNLQEEMVHAGLDRFTENGDEASIRQFKRYFLNKHLEENAFTPVFCDNKKIRKSAETNPLFATMLLQMPQDNDQAKALFKYIFIDGVPSLLSQKLSDWLSAGDAALVKSIFAWGLREDSVYRTEFQAAFESIKNPFALLQNPHFVHEAFQEGSLVKSHYEDCREFTLQKLLEYKSDDYWESAKRDNLNLARLFNEHFSAQIDNKEINGLLLFINNVAASQLVSHDNQQKFKALFEMPEMNKVAIKATDALTDFLIRDAAVTAHSGTMFSVVATFNLESLPKDVKPPRVFGAKS